MSEECKGEGGCECEKWIDYRLHGKWTRVPSPVPLDEWSPEDIVRSGYRQIWQSTGGVEIAVYKHPSRHNHFLVDVEIEFQMGGLFVVGSLPDLLEALAMLGQIAAASVLLRLDEDVFEHREPIVRALKTIGAR